MVKKLKGICLYSLLLFLVLISLHFLASNQNFVAVHTLFGVISTYSLGQILIVAFLAGATIGFMVGYYASLVEMHKSHLLRVHIRKLQKQLEQSERKSITTKI